MDSARQKHSSTRLRLGAAGAFWFTYGIFILPMLFAIMSLGDEYGTETLLKVVLNMIVHAACVFAMIATFPTYPVAIGWLASLAALALLLSVALNNHQPLDQGSAIMGPLIMGAGFLILAGLSSLVALMLYVSGVLSHER